MRLIQFEVLRRPLPSRAALQLDLQNIIDAAYPNFGKVEFFGSTVNNLGFGDADVDVTILVNDHRITDHPLFDPRKLGKLLRKKRFHSVVPICRARVPIVKCYSSRFRCELDINVGYCLGFYNSKLIHAYTLLDVRVKPLICLVKFWNNSEGNIFTSYALSLMIISFLQDRKILPSIQLSYTGEPDLISVPVSRNRNQTELDISFDSSAQRNEFPEKDIWDPQNGVPFLLVSFMRYFANEFTYTSNSWVCIKKGGIFHNQPFFDSCSSRKLVVIDPFLRDRNCTKAIDIYVAKKAFQRFMADFRK